MLQCNIIKKEKTMQNLKVCQAIFGASVILACLCACDSGVKDKNAAKDLSKYRQAYAKPISEWTKPKYR